MMTHSLFRRIAESTKWMKTIILCPLHIPHMFCYFAGGGKSAINQDIRRYQVHFKQKGGSWLYLLYLLANDKYYRQVFYNRIGAVAQILIRWYRPGEQYFIIPKSLEIGGGCIVFHPFSTILNAEKIGSNFSCAHCTTLGFGKNGRPTIGNNVALGSNVTIMAVLPLVTT